MNRRNFLSLLSGIGAALSLPFGFSKRTAAEPPPGLADPFPAPDSVLTAGHIREAWKVHCPGRPCTAAVWLDTCTWEYVRNQAKPALWRGIRCVPGAVLARFDVVDGKRVEIRRGDGERWWTAPFQDYPVFDGDKMVFVLSARRVLPAGDLVEPHPPHQREWTPRERADFQGQTLYTYNRADASSIEGFRNETSGELAARYFKHLREASE